MCQKLISMTFWYVIHVKSILFKYNTYSSHTRQRPYHVEYTGSRPITEVKQRRAWLVLGWVTAWEHHVLLAFFFVHDLNCIYVLILNTFKKPVLFYFLDLKITNEWAMQTNHSILFIVSCILPVTNVRLLHYYTLLRHHPGCHLKHNMSEGCNFLKLRIVFTFLFYWPLNTLRHSNVHLYFHLIIFYWVAWSYIVNIIEFDWLGGPVPAVLQCRVNPWQRWSKLLALRHFPKISLTNWSLDEGRIRC
jgi:hypothetical protein